MEDSVFSPNSPLNNYGFLDELIPNWNQLYTMNPLSLPHLEDSSIDGRSCINNESSLSMGEKHGTRSFSSMADKAESGEQVTQLCNPDVNKRKSRNGTSSISSNYKDAKNRKWKKQKAQKEDRKEKANNVEAPKGYIHVRARRGQATDSHSLAERARREKIGEKMKMLQGLVPGCHKVSGKALMLDEIINYVQSLQTQVEFLSTRLASLDPMFFNFGLLEHLDPIMPFQNQEFMNNNNDSMVLPMPSTQISATTTVTDNSHVTTDSVNFINVNATSTSMTNVETAKPQSFTTSAIVTTTLTDPTAFDGFHVIDSSTNLLQLGQKPRVLPIQDNRILNCGSGMEDQNRLTFFSQFDFGATKWC